MNNVEITVKVNGKEASLLTVSTETFEKTKKAEKVEKQPVATVCDYFNERRLVLKVPSNFNPNIHLNAAFLSINLETGQIANWRGKEETPFLDSYRNRRVIY